LIILVSLCLGLSNSASVFSAGYSWRTMSASDIGTVVLAFEGPSHKPIDVATTPRPGPDMPYCQTFIHANTGRYDYYICEYASGLYSVQDTWFQSEKARFYGSANDLKFQRQNVMTEAKAQDLCRKFAGKHFPGFAVLNKYKIHPCGGMDPSGHPLGFPEAFECTFYQDCGGGVLGPSSCVVVIDSINGQVVSYLSSLFPVLVSRYPRLSGDQALASAIRLMLKGPGEAGAVVGIGITKPDNAGQERLIYSVSFSGIGPVPGRVRSPLTGIQPPIRTRPTQFAKLVEKYIALVDANTGEVIAWDTAL